MMKLKKMIPLVMMLILITGCSDATTPPISEQTPVSTEIKSEENTIPILSIKTVNQDKDVLKFVKEPVTDFVSEAIASWTYGYKIPPAPYAEDCTITLTDGDRTLLLDAEAEVKVRGNWTTSYDKKPLRIKFKEKQSMLDLNHGAEMKNWVLLAEYKDFSMLRNKTALSVAREILGKDGLYAADAELIEVEINEEYWGVYLLTEFQQVNPNRVNITEPEKGYTGTDIGYFLEFDGYFTEEDVLHQFAVDYADNAPLVPFDGNNGSNRTICPLNEGGRDIKKNVGITIKSDIDSQEQHDFIASYINNVYRILYAAAYEHEGYQFNADYTAIVKTEITPEEAVKNVINIDSLADMYILSELTCDADIYWSSFFMDVDFGQNGDHRLTFEAPWDFDSGLGNTERCVDSQGFYAANCVPDVNNTYETINPWLAVLMYEDWFQEIIREKWSDAYDSGVFEHACTMIGQDAEQYQEAFTKSFQKWDNLLHNTAIRDISERARSCKTQQEAAAYLKDWLRNRVEFLNKYWHQ